MVRTVCLKDWNILEKWVKKVIKDNQKLLNRLHVVMDALVIVFSYVLQMQH